MTKLIFFSAVVFAAGVGVPIMASINAGLGARLASPSFATVILLFVAFALAGVYMLASGTPTLPATMPPLYSFSGGIFVVFYILALTTIAPKIGLGNTVLLVLIGQVVSSSIIDHFGLLGAIKSPIGFQKSAGLAFMVMGIFLARRVT